MREVLRNIRKANNMTQTEASKTVGFSQSMWGRAEIGTADNLSNFIRAIIGSCLILSEEERRMLSDRLAKDTREIPKPAKRKAFRTVGVLASLCAEILRTEGTWWSSHISNDDFDKLCSGKLSVGFMLAAGVPERHADLFELTAHLAMQEKDPSWTEADSTRALDLVRRGLL